MLAERVSKDFLYEALSHGVVSILTADSAGAKLAIALHAAAAGLITLPNELGELLTEPLITESRQILQESPPSDQVFEDLTAREHEVLEMMMEGLSNKEIALQLNVSVHTVKFHISSILGKLGAASRTEATTIGLRRGLLTI